MRIVLRYPIQIFATAFIVSALVLSFARASAAVTIQSFNAQVQTSTILVKWITASETDMSGFYLYRSTSQNGSFTKITNLIPVQFPNSVIGSSYLYTDTTVIKGQVYYYKLQAVESGGVTKDFGPVSATIAGPTATPTTAAPTPTRTPTTEATTAATPTNISESANPTATDSPTVYSSPTPLGTPPPTSTPFPTRVALFVDPSAPLPTIAVAAPARPNNKNSAPPAPPAPPKPIQPVAAPTLSGALEKSNSQNPPSQLDNATESDPASATTPSNSDERNPLLVLFTLGGGVVVMSVIAAGAASAYLIARRFIR